MEKKLTIYVVCDTFWPNIGGMEKVAEYSSRALSKKHNVIVFAPYISGYKDDFPFKVFRVKAIPIKKPSTLLALPKIDGKMKECIKNNKPDVIHIHNLAGLSKWFAKFGLKNNIPTFLTLHGYIKHDIESGMPVKFLRPMWEKMFFSTLKYVPNLFTVSKDCQKYYINNGYPHTKVLRNCTDSLEKDEDFCKAILDKYHITDNDNVLCFVNRLIAIKNVHLLVESLKILRDKGFSYKMLIAGDGDEKANLENLVKKYGLDNQVFFLGNLLNRTKVASVYAISDLHLFPSVKDSAGLSQGEAASQNTPTLCMENCAASEMIVDNENGFLSQNDAENYADKIIKIFNDKAKLAVVGENAKQTLYKTWQDYATEVEQIYREKLKK